MRKTGSRDTRRGCPDADAVIAFIIYWCSGRDVLIGADRHNAVASDSHGLRDRPDERSLSQRP